MLTNEQLEEFRECGVVRMPGAIAQSAVEEMLRNVWKCLRERYHIHRGAPDTWPELDDRGVHQVIGVQRFTGSHHLPKVGEIRGGRERCGVCRARSNFGRE